jgi:hypothetical protein
LFSDDNGGKGHWYDFIDFFIPYNDIINAWNCPTFSNVFWAVAGVTPFGKLGKAGKAGKAAKFGRVVHGNSKSSDKAATFYELYQKDGPFLKYGVTQDPQKRYSKAYMMDKKLFPIDKGPRADMLAKERAHVSANPGPLNREQWANAARSAGRGQ